jgi:hypothetical protein
MQQDTPHFALGLNTIRRYEKLQRQSTQQYLEALEEIKQLKAKLNQRVLTEAPMAKMKDRTSNDEGMPFAPS